MTTTDDDVRRAGQADAILDVVAAVEAVRDGRDADLRFLIDGRGDDVFHDLLVATVARAIGTGAGELPTAFDGLSPHTWDELWHRVASQPEARATARHAAPVDQLPVPDRNAELVRAFSALLDADDAVCGSGHSTQVLETARRMALRVAA